MPKGSPGVARVGRDIDIDTLAQDYLSGMTQAELAEKYPVSEEVIRKRLIAHGVPMRPRGQPHGKYQPNGGKTIDKSGYVYVLAPIDHPYRNSGGYIFEHRLVMEQHLGRYLLPEEVVHHINGKKNDNRIENLRLYNQQAQHKSDELKGNRFSVGHGNKGGRNFRSREEILQSLRDLARTLDRPIRRVDLHPPYPSYKAVNRHFGHWSAAVEQALATSPE